MRSRTPYNSFQRRQRSCQVLPRTMQAGFDCAHLGINSSRDFFQRQIFILGKHEDFALERRQILDCLGDDVRYLAANKIHRLSRKLVLL